MVGISTSGNSTNVLHGIRKARQIGALTVGFTGRDGGLVTSHFTYLPRLSPIAQESERLVLEYNPDWSGVDWGGRVPAQPRWSRDAFNVRAFFVYDEPISFSRDAWRGRMRALRGIGASLPEEQVRAFDREHAALLAKIAPPEFTVVHRIDAHFFEFCEDEGLAPV